MNHKEIEDRLVQLAAKRFGKSPESLSRAEDFFTQLGIDSFQAMELLSDLENEFEVEIPDYELQGVSTFVQLAKLVEKKR